MSLPRLAVGLAAFLAVAAVPFYAQSYPFGGPAGFDGHVLEGGEPRTCTVCHSSFALDSGTGSVSIAAPSAVLPGQTVPITITVVNTTPPSPGGTIRQGFQVSVRDHAEPLPGGDGNFLGTLTITDPVNTGDAIGGEGKYVGHTQTGNSQSSWTFDWTAPSEDGVAATVYAVGNAGNGGDGSEGDYVYSARATINVTTVAGEAAPAAPTLDLAAPSPNPVRGTATARLTLAEASTVAVTIVDGRGRTVRTLPTQRLGAGAHSLRLPSAGLAPGTYFVVAEAAGGRRTQPFVVAR
jgi:flagellar hook assembly protein FlgD